MKDSTTLDDTSNLTLQKFVGKKIAVDIQFCYLLAAVTMFEAMIIMRRMCFD